jgi:hypothetical protein
MAVRPVIFSSLLCAAFAVLAALPVAADQPFDERQYPDIPVTSVPIIPEIHGTRLLQYSGSTYYLAPSVRSDDRTETLESVRMALAAADFVPPARLDHFAWCQRPDLAINGWNGTIDSCTATPQGLLVRVQVTPRLSQAGAVGTATLDRYTEYYLFRKDLRFRFLGGEESQSKFRGSLLQL